MLLVVKDDIVQNSPLGLRTVLDCIIAATATFPSKKVRNLQKIALVDAFAKIICFGSHTGPKQEPTRMFRLVTGFWDPRDRSWLGGWGHGYGRMRRRTRRRTQAEFATRPTIVAGGSGCCRRGR
jgi:hypothetical protein